MNVVLITDESGVDEQTDKEKEDEVLKVLTLVVDQVSLKIVILTHFFFCLKVGSHEGDRRIPLVLIFVPGYGRFYGTKYF